MTITSQLNFILKRDFYLISFKKYFTREFHLYLKGSWVLSKRILAIYYFKIIKENGYKYTIFKENSFSVILRKHEKRL